VAHLSPRSSTQDLQQLFHRLVPASVGEGEGPFAAIEKFLLGLTRARATISLYAVPLFIWFATRLFASIRTSLILVYDVPRRATGQHFVIGYLAGKLRDAMMVVLAVSLVLANALLGGGLRLFVARSEGLIATVPALRFFAGGLGYLVSQVVAFGFSVSVFYMAYRHASPRRLPRRAALVGSLFTAALFEVAKRAFAWYLHNLAVVNRFSADANIGAVILFVLWLYYTALVFLIGAVVAETWDLWHRQRGSGGLRPVQLAGS
jgi:membrane protein